MPRSEKTFQGEFRESCIRCLGAPLTYWKYPDLGYSTPFDCHVFKDGVFSAFELKIVKAKDTWNLKNSFKNREFQVDNLMRVKANKGNAWVVINHFLGRGKSKSYMMAPEIARGILDNGGTVSIEEAVESRMVEELPNEGFGIWNLKKLFTR